ncbi:MAG: hypothetical protein ACOC8B_08110 [Gemmatimonadota bacterium]
MRAIRVRRLRLLCAVATLTVAPLGAAEAQSRLDRAARTDTSGDSIAAWTATLRFGTLPDRIAAAGKIGLHPDPTSLPADTRRALIDELARIGQALLYGRTVPGEEGVDAESMGEYFLDLSTTTAHFAAREARLALVYAVAVSRGVQRRVARLGDDAVPPLLEMRRRGFSAGAALETLGLVWLRSDRTGAPLAFESRASILRTLLAGVADDDFGTRTGAVTALGLTRDPAFLPLAVHREAIERRTGRTYIANVLADDVIPVLEAAAAGLTAMESLAGTVRMLRLICDDAEPGARHGACTAIDNRFDAAIEHLRSGRTDAARNVLESAIRHADSALDVGAFSSDEHALIAGGVRLTLNRI